MSNWVKRLVTGVLIVVFLCGVAPRSAFGAATAQEGQAVYVVQAGDNLWSISVRFGVSIDDLRAANNLTSDSINEGDRLVIPGLEWASGTLVTSTVPYGETLDSLSRALGVDPADLAKLNHITSPNELYAGASLILIESSEASSSGMRVSLAPGQSLLEMAVAHNANPYSVASANDLLSMNTTLPGEVLRLPGEGDSGPGALPGAIHSVTINPLPPIQGQVMEIQIEVSGEMSAAGSVTGREFSFFPNGSEYVALQGIHAMQEPGFYPLTIEGVLADGTPFGFSQSIYVRAGDYVYDIPLQVPPETMDPEITGPEDELWREQYAGESPDRLWNGIFTFPSTLMPVDYCLETYDCFPSVFGSRRSYNGSDYEYYHTGLDVGGQIGYDILAAADGIVVYTGELTVRGGATVIDHGWGVYTTYMHQSEILVAAGERVEAGQLIGKVGNTGRVQGPHLHWEVVVGGVPVDPITWLEREYP